MDTPQHCQALAAQIATETDETKRERLRDQFRDECQDGSISTMSEEEPADFSGGGGTGNPPRPPKPGIGG